LKQSRRKIEELLWVAGLDNVARSVYRRTAGRNSTKLREKMTTFYRPLIQPTNLVFDIGANLGILAHIFSSLGARVIALEPNADCVRHIQLSYECDQIETIQAVAGADNGVAVLNVSDERDDISSMSTEWITAIKNEHAEYRDLWSRKVTVPVLTLDTLIKHYGVPYFIKIDVEGFEESVLKGLSTQPPLLSFEFNRALPDATDRCLELGIFASGSVFNFAMGDPVKFELPEWVGKNELRESLGRLEKGDRYGDIFVKAPDFGGSGDSR
jgi:FkbM family methyltransferase